MHRKNMFLVLKALCMHTALLVVIPCWALASADSRTPAPTFSNLDLYKRVCQRLVDAAIANPAGFEQSLRDAVTGRDVYMASELINAGWDHGLLGYPELYRIYEAAVDAQLDGLVVFMSQIFTDYDGDFNLSRQAKAYTLALLSSEVFVAEILEHASALHDYQESFEPRAFTDSMRKFIADPELFPLSRSDLRVLKGQVFEALTDNRLSPLTPAKLESFCYAWARKLKAYGLLPSLKTGF